MRAIFIKLFIFIFAAEAAKNIAAHHQTGTGKYVADDKAKVSVRSWLPEANRKFESGPFSRFLIQILSFWLIDKYTFLFQKIGGLIERCKKILPEEECLKNVFNSDYFWLK